MQATFVPRSKRQKSLVLGFVLGDGNCYDSRLAELARQLVAEFLARELDNQ